VTLGSEDSASPSERPHKRLLLRRSRGRIGPLGSDLGRRESVQEVNPGVNPKNINHQTAWRVDRSVKHHHPRTIDR